MMRQTNFADTVLNLKGEILKVFLLYFSLALLWVSLTDELILTLAQNIVHNISQPQSIKAFTFFFFVSVASICYFFMRFRKREQIIGQDQINLEGAYDSIIEGWAKALELRDHETGGHSRRVVEMMDILAREFGLSEDERKSIRRGALLHDIGKMGIPDSILLKPGKLTPEERKIIERHPVFAYEWLASTPYLKSVVEIPYYHHEHWDGSGYPLGLKGENIPFAARLFTVVDAADALASERPYRKAWSFEEIYAYLKQEAGKTLDPKAVEAFVRLDVLRKVNR